MKACLIFVNGKEISLQRWTNYETLKKLCVFSVCKG